MQFKFFVNSLSLKCHVSSHTLTVLFFLGFQFYRDGVESKMSDNTVSAGMLSISYEILYCSQVS